MLLNPFTDRLDLIPGTRCLQDPLGLSGVQLIEQDTPFRIWTIQWVLAPIPNRALGGIRAKLIDAKGFITFCNQRDLEVLLGYGVPGKYCSWAKKNYPSPQDPEWYGLCCDTEDLNDDTFEYECRLRQHYAGYQYLPSNLELTRRVHVDSGHDVEEMLVLLWDMDRDTGQAPDTRYETVHHRWSRVERTRVNWEHLT